MALLQKTQRGHCRAFSAGQKVPKVPQVRCVALRAFNRHNEPVQLPQLPVADAMASLGSKLVAVAAAALLVVSPASAFGPVSVKLADINVTKIECGAGVSTVGGVTFSGATQAAACLAISAQADNPSGKPLFNADVFGRVYDANGEAAIDDTENIRIAYIDEIPPGSSKVSFKLFVPLEQYNLGPLKLVNFKATGFPGKMLPGQGSGLIGPTGNEDCDITGDCEAAAEEALIR